MLIALGLCAISPAWRDAVAWQAVTSGSGYLPLSYSVAVTVDVNGDVIGGGWFGEVRKFRGTDGTELWRTSFWARDIAADAAGDVFAVGGATVIKLSGIDGSELWRREIVGSPGSGNNRANAVVADAEGNVVVVGAIGDATTLKDFAVCKFAGGDGADFWSSPCRSIHSSDYYDEAFAVGLDPSGDIVAGGGLGEFYAFAVVKYSAATGTELWRYQRYHGWRSEARSISFGGAGDVIAVGRYRAVKLAGDTGTELWTAAGGAQGAVDGAGDVAIAVASGPLIVRKLAGNDGATLWERQIDGAADDDGAAFSVAVDANGDVFIAGGLVNKRPTWSDLLVAKLAAADGAELWRRLITGTYRYSGDVGRTVKLNAAGDPVVGGVVRNADYDFLVMQLDSSTGGEISLSGRRLRLIDNANNPSKRRLVVLAKDRNVVAPPLGSPRDPTIGGASLEILNPTTGETDTFALPAANWSPMLTSSKLKGYKYRDTALVAGPCKKVSITTNRRLTASCKGEQINFSLDEPLQGSLGVRLSTGTDGLDYCMLFGGEIRRDKPASQDGPGAFEARGAPIATSCAEPPSASAGL
jgi:hypothetical protein